MVENDFDDQGFFPFRGPGGKAVGETAGLDARKAVFFGNLQLHLLFVVFFDNDVLSLKVSDKTCDDLLKHLVEFLQCW